MSRRFVRGMVSWAGLAAAIAPSAAAQTAPPIGEAVAPAKEFRLPDDRIGRRISPILLLSREDVRADLKLDKAQSDAARQAAGELYERASALKGKKGPAVVEQRRQIDEACRGWINQWLSQAQRDRLEQIGLQWEGAGALANEPTLAAQIGLTASQKKAIAEAAGRRDERRAAGTPALEAERELAVTALASLRSGQRERWKTMLGPVFSPSLSDPAVLPAGAATSASNRRP